MTPISIDEYKDAMREEICSGCVSFVDDEQDSTRCVHENSGQCTVFVHLDEVVDAISSVDSDCMEPYIEALRHKVCAKCDHQDKRGVCDLRDIRTPLPTWCILDSHFNLVVGAVEEVKRKHRDAVAGLG